MSKRHIIFHRLIQKDLNSIVRYYNDESGIALADRFYDTFIFSAKKTLEHPERCHSIHSYYRRARVEGFPYHFLYKETAHGIRILVLRHDKRRPTYCLSRK
jgi:toxin ParE1/3/4